MAWEINENVRPYDPRNPRPSEWWAAIAGGPVIFLLTVGAFVGAVLLYTWPLLLTWLLFL